MQTATQKAKLKQMEQLDILGGLLRGLLFVTSAASVAKRAAAIKWNEEESVKLRHQLKEITKRASIYSLKLTDERVLVAIKRDLTEQLYKIWIEIKRLHEACDYPGLLRALLFHMRQFSSFVITKITSGRDMRKILFFTFRLYLALIMISLGVFIQMIRTIYAILLILKLVLHTHISQFKEFILKSKVIVGWISGQLNRLTKILNMQESPLFNDINNLYRLIVKVVNAGKAVAYIYAQVLENYQSLYKHIFEDSTLFRSALTESLSTPAKEFGNM